MDDKDTPNPSSCFIETTIEASKTKDGGHRYVYTEKKHFTGDAADRIAQEQSKAIERESQAKSEGIKTGLTLLGGGGALALIFAARSPNASTTPASGGTITTDAKVPGNDNIPGNGSGAA